MLIENYGKTYLLEFTYFVQQFVIQKKFSKFDFPGSDYVWCVENQMLMLLVVKLCIFHIQQELSRSTSNLIPFKRYDKSKSLFERVVQVKFCKVFQEIFIKNKNTVS